MTFQEKNSNGLMNGATPVDIVPAPGSAVTRIVRNVTLANPDSVAATFTLLYNDNGSLRPLPTFTLGPGESAEYETIQVLDATTKSLQAKLGGAHTTTAPTFVATFGEVA